MGIVRAAKATVSFVQHPIATTCETRNVVQRLGVRGTYAATKAEIFNTLLQVSALGAIPIGLAHGDMTQELLVGGYAGTVLGLPWAKGKLDAKAKADLAALQYKALKDHKLSDQSLIDQLKNPKASVEARIELLKSLGPEQRMALLKAKGQTAALVGALAVSGYLAVKLQGTPQAIFDQLFGGMFGPLIALRSTSTETKNLVKKARDLARDQVRAEEHLARQEREVMAAEFKARIAHEAANLAKGQGPEAKLKAKAAKLEESAKTSRASFNEAKQTLRSTRKEQNRHFSEMMATLTTETRAAQIDGYERVLNTYFDKNGLVPNPVAAPPSVSPEPAATAPSELVTDVVASNRPKQP